MISLIVLTKNEEHDLPACLEALKWCDDVHVLDSGSTDKTTDIAVEYGARVWSNKFESFGQQRNFALDHLRLAYEWILFLDADEVVTDKFRRELFAALEKVEDDVAGFYCCWKMMLEGQWLKYSDNFPKWQFRLMRKGRARFTDFGHGQKEHNVVGKTLYLQEPYLHYAFSKGWFVWFDRHNKYSSLEAVERLGNCPPLQNVFSRNGSVRNPALKSWLSKLPGWPFFRFIHAYVFNLGFLEGIPGFIYCTNMGFYEFLIQIKMREIRKRQASQ